jgi:hypothetical protein
VVRVVERGKILEQISTRDDGVFNRVLGGEHGRTLNPGVTPNFDETEPSTARPARLAATSVGVLHADPLR